MAASPTPLIKRKNVLGFCQPFVEGQRRLVVLRAGAGYGKSVAAQQIAALAGLPTVNLLCASMDRDPGHFARKLVSSLQSLQPGLEVERTLRPLVNSGTPDEAILAARDSFKAAFAHLEATPLIILLDDAHLLRESPALPLLRLFHDLSPDAYRFLITTRRTLATDGKPVFNLFESMLVNQTQLEFDKLEILELYHDNFALDLTPDQADLLWETTEGGWPLGVVLLKGEVSKLPKGFQLRSSNEVHQYLIKECLEGLAPPVREQLASLSQLEAIPRDMLRDLGMQQARDALQGLCDSGLFTTTYQMDDARRYYRLHHLFQETLHLLIKEKISPNGLEQFNDLACAWLEEHGKLEDALLLLARSKNWPKVSSFMRRNGGQLLVHNKLGVIRDSLADCPEETLLHDEWLAATYGFAILFASPPQARELLEQAFSLARTKQEDMAELIAGLGLLNYLLLLDSDLWRMRKVSRRVAHLTEKLLQENGSSFPLVTLCAFLLPPTIAFSSSDYELASRCTGLLKQHYQGEISRDAPIEFFFANLYAYKFIGNTKKVIQLMQRQIFKVNDVSLNPAARFFIIGFFANLYAMLRVDDYYYYLFNETTGRFPEICDSASLTGFFKVIEMDLLLADSQYERVIELAGDSLQIEAIAGSLHISSMCWQYYAMAQALGGNQDEARKAVKKAVLQRAKAGGSIFILMAHNVLAAVLSLTGEHKGAFRMFDCILRRSLALRDGYQRPMTYAYRANLHLSLGHEDEALADLGAMLQCMHEHQNLHFFYWDAGIMRRLLEFYLKHQAPTPLVQELLRKHFGCDVLTDGSLVPRLKISLAEQKIYSPEAAESFVRLAELPGVEAKLMELLLARRGHQVALQECIEHLWDAPDEMKDPRNNLYVQLNKLRGRLAFLVGKQKAKHYLQNRAGYLTLRHVEVDQYHLEKQARKALALMKDQQWWDAEMRFRRVHRLSNEFPAEYPWSLENRRLFTDTAVSWAELAQKCQDPATALRAAEMGLKFNPTHDQLHEMRYRLYLRLNMRAKAEQAKREYARAIGAEGLAFHELGKSMV